jgi:3-oxoacyl-[acyl-carrier protein] reductase
LNGKVCVITGAGQGIGEALAALFAQRGARVVLAELNGARAAEVAARIKNSGFEAVAIETDVTDPRSVADLAARTHKVYGPVAALINNARWSGLAPTPVTELSDESWRRALDVNVTGAFNCIRALVPDMIASGWGRIINMSSATVRLPPPRPYVHYITSKAALLGLTRALARELGEHGITVNAVLPGSVETGVQRHLSPEERERRVRATQSVPRVITPDDVVGAAWYLCSEEAALVTGQSLAVDGGLTFG